MYVYSVVDVVDDGVIVLVFYVLCVDVWLEIVGDSVVVGIVCVVGIVNDIVWYYVE